eukprot:13414736-Ditylum_brightwellii.AAC.1
MSTSSHVMTSRSYSTDYSEEEQERTPQSSLEVGVVMAKRHKKNNRGRQKYEREMTLYSYSTDYSEEEQERTPQSSLEAGEVMVKRYKSNGERQTYEREMTPRSCSTDYSEEEQERTPQTSLGPGKVTAKGYTRFGERKTYERVTERISRTDGTPPHATQEKEANKVFNKVPKDCQSQQHRGYHDQPKSIESRETKSHSKQSQGNPPLLDARSKLTDQYSSRKFSRPEYIRHQTSSASSSSNFTPRPYTCIQVLSSNSPHYSSSSKSLSSRAPLAMRILHELAIGLTDAYLISGILPQKKNMNGKGLVGWELYNVTENGEEGWNTILSFLINLDFLIELVDTICSLDTPASIRQRMKHHAHFRPLRSVIRAANNVITSRFLVKRIDRHRLLFRVVSPHNCGSKDVGREE